MRLRIWLFAAIVATALGAHLALLTRRVEQIGEENIRSRLAMASGAVKAQLDLLDARAAPRPIAMNPDLIEAMRTAGESVPAQGKIDEKALRAAAAVAQPEPDILIVANAQVAAMSRRGKAASLSEDAGRLPFVKATLEGGAAPAFANVEGVLYRVAAARIPGSSGAVVVGSVVDDRFAALLRSRVDADVTFLKGDKAVASSLPQSEQRARLLAWAKSPAQGYGFLPVPLPFIGNALAGKLPLGASRTAIRGALQPLDSGVQAAVTIPAAPYFTWFARYQAFYLAALGLFVLTSFVFGLLSRAPKAQVAQRPPASRQPQVRVAAPAGKAQPASEAASAAEKPPPAPRPSLEVPWTGQDGDGVLSGPKPVLRPPPPAEPAARAAPPEAKEPAPAKSSASQAAAPATPLPAKSIWSGDPFSATAGQFAVPSAKGAAGHDDEKWSGPPAAPPAEAGAEEAWAEPAPMPAWDEGATQISSAAGGGPVSLPDATRGAAPGAPVAEGVPHDEPTRVEPVSAALIDKLRERDESAPAGAGVEASGPPRAAASAAEETAAQTAVAQRGAEGEAADPDEAHWQETFQKFRELRAQTGEPADKVSYEKFVAKLRKNREDLLARHHCKGVRFVVYLKDGKAAIKASAIR